jgi:ATP-dependent Clp protease protease subunit
MEDKKDAKKSEGLAQRLLKSRSIMIFGEINAELAEKVCAQLLILAAESDEAITVYVNSPGGHVESGDSIYDMIKFISAPVIMVGTGYVASAGALIYVAAKKENRYCLPNTRFLLHQPSGGAGGSALDIKIQAEEIIKMKERLNQIFAKETGNSIETVREQTDRDFWLTTSEAIEYGLVSKVVNSIQEIR